MSTYSTTNIHGIVSIEFERVSFETFVSHRFTFKTEDGGVISVDAFAAEPLSIQQAPDRIVAETSMGAAA